MGLNSVRWVLQHGGKGSTVFALPIFPLPDLIKYNQTCTPSVTHCVTTFYFPMSMAVAMTFSVHETDHSKHKTSQRLRWSVALMVTIHLALGLHAAAHLSPTNDEYWHLGIGVDILKTGRFDQDTINPPLVRILTALPTLPLSVGYTSDGIAPGDTSAFGDRLVDAATCEPVWLWFSGRCVVLGFSLAAGLVIVTWSKEVWGDHAALVSGIFWFLNPAVLGHAALVTHDIPAAAMFVICLRTAWAFGRNPSVLRATGIGVTLGLALLTKFTAVLLVGLIPVIIFIAWNGFPDGTARGTLRQSLKLAACACIVAAVSCLVLNLGYMGTGFGTSLAAAAPASQLLRTFADDFPDFSQLPLPLPVDWIKGVDQLRIIMEHQHPVFLNGEWSFEGFRSYYQTGLGFQLFVIIGLVIGLVTSSSRNAASNRAEGTSRRCVSCCLVVVIALTTIASLGRNQLGLRYILPLFPFLAMMAGASFVRISAHRTTCIAVCTMALLSAGWSLRHHPNHIAYFNGHLHLIDSNLDWGQSLLQLAAYLEQSNLQLDGLAYFGSAVPTDWGIASTPLPPELPEAGCYAVSVNFVMGRPHVVRNRERLIAINFAQYSYFRQLQPTATVGESIYVYEVSSQDAANVRFKSGMPPLPPVH